MCAYNIQLAAITSYKILQLTADAFTSFFHTQTNGPCSREYHPTCNSHIYHCQLCYHQILGDNIHPCSGLAVLVPNHQVQCHCSLCRAISIYHQIVVLQSKPSHSSKLNYCKHNCVMNCGRKSDMLC